MREFSVSACTHFHVNKKGLDFHPNLAEITASNFFVFVFHKNPRRGAVKIERLHH